MNVPSIEVGGIGGGWMLTLYSYIIGKLKRCIMRFLVWLVLVGGVLGCGPDQEGRTRSNTKTIGYHPEEADSLHGQVLSNADTIANPSSLVKVGEYLLVADISSDPPAHILTSKDGSYVRSLGTQGRGPGEFRGIWSFDVVSDSPGGVWAYDLNALRLTYIPVPQYVEGDYTLGDRLVTLETGYSPTSPHWLGDSLLVSPGFLTEEGRLAYLDPQTGTTRRIDGVSPPNPNGDPIAVLQHAYQAFMDIEPTDSLLVLGTRYADQLEIYRTDGTQQTVIRGPDHFDPVYEVGSAQGEPVRVSTDETRTGYLDVKATRSAIYALYAGRHRAGSASLVHVLDWQGTLQTVYKLDEPVRAIAVDEESDRLYASRAVSGPAILTYPVPIPPEE